ncbi:TIR domain-containing protein [Actinokineospora globicatena]|uniref:TIR domain-containing protein n=1 Tax=Actinokineospora globicatena TaxID=103729 RepID=A0A9W6V822_9PSEU|nr:TIR domain-containing protein [Actinokineospora globicatena]GLW93425.1 hypothetical protein Aglo03_42410 [Actinokineospora globicatena]
MYEYDVYISYDRDSETVSPWVRHHFYPRLKELIDDNIVEKVRVFFDQEVGAGAKFPAAGYDALLHTKILVPVYSPKYFASEWCLAEWDSMAQREDDMGMHTSGLIFPVVYSDSDSFPPWAVQRPVSDLSEWNEPRIHYQDTHDYFVFRKRVNKFAAGLVRSMREAPQWQPDWPISQPEPGFVPRMRKPRWQP